MEEQLLSNLLSAEAAPFPSYKNKLNIVWHQHSLPGGREQCPVTVCEPYHHLQSPLHSALASAGSCFHSLQKAADIGEGRGQKAGVEHRAQT